MDIEINLKAEDLKKKLNLKNGVDGKDGKPGKQGLKGEKGLRGFKGDKGNDGEDGKDGKDGSPDNGVDIVKKINSIPLTSPAKINVEHISGLELFMGGNGIGRRSVPLSENLWDRNNTTNTLIPHIANDNLDIGSGDFTTTGSVLIGTTTITNGLFTNSGGDFNFDNDNITTTGDIVAGIFKSNNYQNATGTESLVWNAGSDWWEFGNDLYANGYMRASTGFIGPKWYPSADSTTAIQIMKADGITPVLVVDTTNGAIGIGNTPSSLLDITRTTATVDFGFTNNYGSILGNVNSSATSLTINNSTAGSFTLASNYEAGYLGMWDASDNRLCVSDGTNIYIGTTSVNISTGVYTSSGLISPKWYPSADSTTALQILKADGTTPIVNIDTTNNRVGINTTVPQSLLDVQGPAGTGTACAGILYLATKELTIVAGDELGRINFNAPLESSGTDSRLPGASIWAVAEADFTSTVNSTSLILATGTSAAATEKIRITSDGLVGINNNAPAATLDVVALSLASAAEVLANFTVSDATTSYLQIYNGTTVNSRFLPTFKGYNGGDQRYAMTFAGYCADAAYGSALYPGLLFSSRSTVPAKLTTVPVVSFANSADLVLTSWYDGSCKIGGSDVINATTTGAVKPDGFLQVEKTSGSNIKIMTASTTLNETATLRYTITTSQSVESAAIQCLRTNSPNAADCDLLFFTRGSSSSTEKMRIKSTGLVGINTTAPDKQVEINSATGDCLRLTYNDSTGSATYYSDLTVSNAGVLTIKAVGNNFILQGADTTADPRLTFDSGNDGYIEWQEDEQQFHIEGGVEVNGWMNMGGSFFPKQVNDAGPMTATNGTIGEIVFNTADSKFYGCTVTGTPATWAAFH